MIFVKYISVLLAAWINKQLCLILQVIHLVIRNSRSELEMNIDSDPLSSRAIRVLYFIL